METCYYDGACGLCRRSARWLVRMDVFGRLRMVDQTMIADNRLPIGRDAALVGMPVVAEDGSVLVGFTGVRVAMMQTPLALVGWVLYLPVVSWVGERVYRWVARRRVRACVVGGELGGRG